MPRVGFGTAPAFALALVLALPPAAGARADAERLVRVIAPAQGQGVFASGQVVKVKVRRGARLTVHVNRRDVTRSLRLRTLRRGQGMRTLRGRLSQRLVRGGPKAVTFKVRARAGKRRDADDVLVQSVVRRPGFMTLRLKRRGGPAPVEAIVRTRTHRIWLRATLNGRRIERVAKSRRVGERRLLLTRTEGLRPGRNVLVVAANSARGRGDVERRVFRLPRKAVIPGVRALDHVRVRAPVRIDAGPTFAPRSVGRLSYRWRFGSRPRGSRARLRGAARRVVRFRPDVPGHYSVRLVARPTARKGAKGAAAAALATEVSAQAPIPPYGLPLSTDPAKGLSLNGATTPMPSGQGAMLVVTIDSATGAITQTSPVPGTYGEHSGPNLVHDAAALIDVLDPIDDPNQIVVVIGAAGAPNQAFIPSRLGGLASVLSDFGVGDDNVGDLATAIAYGTPFAFVAARDAAAATVNVSTGAGAGLLEGRLRLTGLTDALTGKLVFEQPDYRTFQLGGGHGPTVVSQLNPPPGTKPFNWIDAPTNQGTSMQLTIVDAVTLTTTAAAAAVNTCDDGALGPIRNVLSKYAADRTQLILFKMAAPPACPGQQRIDLSAFSKQLAALGANRDIFLRSLQYPGNAQFPPSAYPGAEYVFFGGAGVQPVEGSSLITTATPTGGQVATSSPTLSGILRKSDRGQWIPVATRTSEQLTGQLRALAVRAPVSYGYPTDVAAGTKAQYAAAESRLFDLLVAANVVCTPGPSCGVPRGVRVNYANQELLDNLSAAQAELDCKPDGTTDGTLKPDSGATYTQAQLNALQAQVCAELKDLAAVHGQLFEQLRTNVYTPLKSDSTLDLLSLSNSYVGFLKDEQDKQLADRHSFLNISGEAGVVLGDLFTGVIEVGDYMLAPETGGASVFAGAALGALFTLGGDTIGLASGALGVGESADKVAPTLVTVGNLFSYIQSSYGYASARLDEIEALVNSDPTKLAAAAEQVSGGSWNLEKPVNEEHQASDVITFQQRVSALRYMLPRMLGVDASPCDAGGSSDDPTTYVAWTRFDAEGGNPPTYLSPSPHRLRSVHLDSADAQALATRLFPAPFAPDSDPLAAGPTSAALAESPFFMWQVAPTTDSDGGACSDVFPQ